MPVSQVITFLKNRALDLAAPPRCVVCDADLEDSTAPALCEPCRDAVARSPWTACNRCGARVPEYEAGCESCRGCEADKLRFVRTFCLGAYEGPLQETILQMKHDRSRTSALALGRLLAERIGSEAAALGVEVVASVPIHPWRKWVRGADPAGVLSEVIAECLDLPHAPGLLRRVRNTSPQKGLSRPARFRNQHGQMALGAGYHLSSPVVLVVDDVMTTGATCNEATRVLRQAGARAVAVAVVGRTMVGV